jgi:hypothetical protein
MFGLNDTYVIVCLTGSTEHFFQDYTSSDKAELEKKCEELNEEVNEHSKKFWEEHNLDPMLIIKYHVLDFKSAIKQFDDICFDSYATHDASY